jgi:TrmH family RNA methyltransferase
MSDAIASSRNPFFRKLKKLDASSQYRRREGLFLLWGSRFVDEALGAGSQVAHLILSEQRSRQAFCRPLLRLARQRDLPTTILSDTLLSQLSPGVSDQGTLALIRVRHAPLATLMRDAVDPILIVVDRIQDPGNLGVIVRLAEAAHVTALVTVPGTVDPYHTRAARASAGSILRVPTAELPPWEEWQKLVARHHLRVVVSTPREGDDVGGIDLKGPLALVVGNEGEGVGEVWTDSADLRVSIHLGGSVESLNVTSAAAILLYEAARQRRT